MRGGLSYPLPDNGGDVQYGSQSRLPAQSGTRVIYYLQRLDNQANPDKVQGSTAWIDAQKFLVRNTLGTISYSSNFGNQRPMASTPDSRASCLSNNTDGDSSTEQTTAFSVGVSRKASMTNCITSALLPLPGAPPSSVTSPGPISIRARSPVPMG